jgi:hypothetical protein
VAKNIIVVLIFFVSIRDLATALQPRGEHIVIRNNLNRSILLYKKYHNMDEKAQVEIEGIYITIVERYADIISAKREADCIIYFPSYGLFQNIYYNYYEKLASISLTNKLKAIFKEFKITDADGNVLFDIRNMKEDDFVYEHYEDKYPGTYILEISD